MTQTSLSLETCFSMVAIGLSTLGVSLIVVVLLILAFISLAYGLYGRRGGVGGEDREGVDEAREEIRNMGRGTSGRRGS